MTKPKPSPERRCLCGGLVLTTRGPARCDGCRLTTAENRAAYQRDYFQKNGHRVRSGLCPCGEPAANKRGSPRCDACRAKQQLATRRRCDLSIYGLTPADYDRKLVEQDARCAICATTEPGRRQAHFSVDHDHATGVVRGLLCHFCNVALGHFGDDPARLRAAAAYLEEHRRAEASDANDLGDDVEGCSFDHVEP